MSKLITQSASLLLLLLVLGTSCALEDPPDPPVLTQDGDLGLGGGGGGSNCGSQTYNGPIGSDPGWDGQAESFCRAAQAYACAGYNQELQVACGELRNFFGVEDECPYCP